MFIFKILKQYKFCLSCDNTSIDFRCAKNVILFVSVGTRKMASSLVDTGYLSPQESIELDRVIKGTVTNFQTTHPDRNPRKHFDKIYETVIKSVANYFKGLSANWKSIISSRIMSYLENSKPVTAIESSK